MKRAEPEVGQANGPSPDQLPQVPAGAAGNATAASVVSPERTYPIMHLATFGIPDDRGDFGSGAVELMTDNDLFITLFEYGPESVGQPLFSRQGFPRELSADQFNPNGLQRTIAGQSGLQIFFTEGNRAFCLFVALGSHANRAALAKKANAALASITIEPR